MKYLLFLSFVYFVVPCFAYSMEPNLTLVPIKISSSESLCSLQENISQREKPQISPAIAQRKKYFEAYRQKPIVSGQGYVVRRDSAMSEELALLMSINRMKERRGSLLARAQAYMKAAAENSHRPSQDTHGV